ncbi:MAG: hypothetical protein INR62_05080 [Rhodospirillales bacterium]|nr:hypothetical protein [Acetobacter sp.]
MRFLPRRRLLVTALVLLLLVGCGSGEVLHAQDESENNTTSSTTYDSTGKVTALSVPLTITVDSRRGPFTYQIDPDVHVYRADNKADTLRDVRVGQQVTVYYFKRLGQQTVARLVILGAGSAAK